MVENPINQSKELLALLDVFNDARRPHIQPIDFFGNNPCSTWLFPNARVFLLSGLNWWQQIGQYRPDSGILSLGPASIKIQCETGVELSGTSSDRIQGFSNSFTSKEHHGHKTVCLGLKISENLERIGTFSIHVTRALFGPVR